MTIVNPSLVYPIYKARLGHSLADLENRDTHLCTILYMYLPNMRPGKHPPTIGYYLFFRKIKFPETTKFKQKMSWSFKNRRRGSHLCLSGRLGSHPSNWRGLGCTWPPGTTSRHTFLCINPKIPSYLSRIPSAPPLLCSEEIQSGSLFWYFLGGEILQQRSSSPSLPLPCLCVSRWVVVLWPWVHNIS